MDIKTVNEIIRETDVMTVSYNINVTEEEFSGLADNPEAYRHNIISSTEQWLGDIEHNTGIMPESITVKPHQTYTNASKCCTTHPIKDTSRLSSHTERYSHTRFTRPSGNPLSMQSY